MDRLAQADRASKEYLEQTVAGYLAFIEQVSRGDLTTRLSVNGSNDDLTRLGHNLNTMVESLGQMTSQIRDATVNITAAAAEIWENCALLLSSTPIESSNPWEGGEETSPICLADALDALYCQPSFRHELGERGRRCVMQKKYQWKEVSRCIGEILCSTITCSAS